MIKRILLYPFSLLYDAVTRFRNHLYDIGNKVSHEFEVFVLSVGNLSVGGTGKTPMVEYLLRLLKDQYNISTLSRGYGRKTRGFILADEGASSESIGDEPYQIYSKFSPEVSTAVGEERIQAIPEILFQKPDIDLIILDDAFQHRKVKPDFSILLTEYSNPFFEDYVLPSGWLRESRNGAERADAIIVTKCPHQLSEQKMSYFADGVEKYSSAPLYFTSIQYSAPVPCVEGFSFAPNIFLFTGIANSKPLVDYVAGNFKLLGKRQFPDHYSFKEKDVESLLFEFEELPSTEKILLTTEKDWSRLRSNPVLLNKLQDKPLFYLPIEPQFLKDEAIFVNRLKSAIEKSGKLE